MRLGMLGGSFDPPHLGHLLAASDAFEALSLDKLIFIPTAIQPLKVGLDAAPAAARLAMVQCLVAADERFAVDPIETERPGVSFSVDTVAAYAERYPAAERFFLVGADVVTSLASWREPGRIAELATIVVIRRGDESPVVAGRIDQVAVREIQTRRIDISSTEIRARVRAGQSINGFVPPAVESYIRTAGLYR